MPELAPGVFDTPGLPWLAATFLIAGLVRGFAGFGTALVFMPIGALFLPIPLAIALVTVAGMIAWPLILPRGLARADRAEVLTLGAAAIVTAPVGLWLLTWADRETLRWAVSIAAGLTLAALLSGWRYQGRVRGPGLAGVGGLAGVLGGTTGLTGPPVILFYLASTRAAEVVRANTIVFLALLDLGIIAVMILRGLVGWEILPLALLLSVPYGLGIVLGQRWFHPDREKLYRSLAYSVIAGAILTGLPLFDR